MTWADFTAMMADLAGQPVILLLCALCGFAAGAWAGLLARDDHRYDDYPDSSAGDTHANWPQIPAHAPPLNPTSRPRVRAIGAAALKPSYDGSKEPPTHHRV
jgi:hypothetical protein